MNNGIPIPIRTLHDAGVSVLGGVTISAPLALITRNLGRFFNLEFAQPGNTKNYYETNNLASASK